MQKANVWAEKIMIPTYEIGEPEKNPIFLEKRVYQRRNNTDDKQKKT